MRLIEEFNISHLREGDILFDKFHFRTGQLDQLNLETLDARGQYMYIDHIHEINYNNDRYTSIVFRAFTPDWKYKYTDVIQTVLIETKQKDRIYLVEFETVDEEAKVRLATNG